MRLVDGVRVHVVVEVRVPLVLNVSEGESVIVGVEVGLTVIVTERGSVSAPGIFFDPCPIGDL